MSLILDAISASLHAVLFDGNLAVTSDGPDVATARANAVKSSGKAVFEVSRVNPIIFGQCDVGLTNKVAPSTTSLLGTVIMDRDGFVFINSVFVHLVSATTPVMFAVDFTNHLLWIKDTGGAWNNTGADPCAGTGGFDISAIDATGLYPFAIVDNSNRSATFNFGATPFVQTKPTCMDAWDPPPAPAGNRLAQLARVKQFRQVARMTSLALPAHVQMAMTEPSDRVSGLISPEDAIVLAATEDSDTVSLRVNGNVLPPAVDGDIIYVLHEDNILVPPDKFPSQIVILSEPTISALPFTEH